MKIYITIILILSLIRMSTKFVTDKDIYQFIGTAANIVSIILAIIFLWIIIKGE
jgi:hypothetical protein